MIPSWTRARRPRCPRCPAGVTFGQRLAGASNLSSERIMNRLLGAAVVLTMALASCRGYDLEPRLTSDDGLVSDDQYARYGREQAQLIAIGREFAHADEGTSPEARQKQAEAAVTYARTLPDVVDVKADPQSLLMTVRFRSGWRTMITPIASGERGSETPGLPAPTSQRAPR